MENMGGVLHMGQKTSKYMEYPVRQAPHFGREACQYSKDFARKPEGDFVLNNEVGEQLREKGTNGSTVIVSQSSTAKSSYAEEFGTHNTSRAKRDTLFPEHRYPEGGKFLYGKSLSQSIHFAPSSEVRWKGNDMRPTSALVNPRSNWEDAMKTTYRGDFLKRDRPRRRTPTHSFSDPNLTTLRRRHLMDPVEGLA